MGEAKRRKAQGDPAYGRKTRGLILSPPIRPLPNGVVVESAQIDPHQLRHALLFWDELVWPSNNFIHIASDPECEFLETTGILK